MLLIYCESKLSRLLLSQQFPVIEFLSLLSAVGVVDGPIAMLLILMVGALKPVAISEPNGCPPVLLVVLVVALHHVTVAAEDLAAAVVLASLPLSFVAASLAVVINALAMLQPILVEANEAVPTG